MARLLISRLLSLNNLYAQHVGFVNGKEWEGGGGGGGGHSHKFWMDLCSEN